MLLGCTTRSSRSRSRSTSSDAVRDDSLSRSSLTNAITSGESLCAERGPGLARIRTRVEKLMTEPGRDHFEGLARICREHVVDGLDEHSPFESTCVHVANRYGTRSSLLLELATEPAANRLWTTDGPPCERSYENRSSLLRELGVRLSNRAGTEPT